VNSSKIAALMLMNLLLMGTSLGGYDITAEVGAENLTQSQFESISSPSAWLSAEVQTGAPTTTLSDAGTEQAVYTDQAPSADQLTGPQPTDLAEFSPDYIYYQGSYLGWDTFSTLIQDSFAGLWIERAMGWSWYASLPLGGWARELIYVPTYDPIDLYEIYPGGYVKLYSLMPVAPGYYYLWFYADVPGRHKSVFYIGDQQSNMLVVDVYQVSPPQPQPTPKERCESNPQCSWSNGHCYCRGLRPPTPKEKCESNPECDWFNGHCYCRGLIPEDPEKTQCESNPQCSWSNGHCYCRGLNPEDPEKTQCESNPQCSWSNGHCYCRGLNPPEPEPMPGPEPMPEPSPSPQEQCEDNPSCHWSGGRCLCTGLGSEGGSESLGLQ